MPFDLEKIVRPHILKVKPYSSARDEFSGSAEVYLDANENAFGSSSQEINNRYPDPLQWQVKEKIAQIKHVPKEQIFLGNGSDEPIDLIIRAFCTPGKDEIIQLPPTYGMYQVSAEINDVFINNVPLDEHFQIQTDKVINAIHANTKVIFICSPNNPSGNSVSVQSIETILRSFNGLVVIDEAYIDFSSQPSFTQRLAEFPNLVVLQTFSKAWGLANLRVGMAFASLEIISLMNKIKPPYNIGGKTQEAALFALGFAHQTEAMVQEILEEREKLISALEGAPGVIQVYPSDSNFLLVKTTNAHGIYNALVSKGIIVRDRSKVYGCEGCLRVTVGTPEENERLLKEWNKIS
ncbi:MAG: histidinol-phosphate transaminase [Cytophagales bacterium]|nr:histidinol-phosphate transaminase [Cytophagales bacterium]